MIDPNVAGAYERVDARRRDVLGAYRPGFEPEIADVAGRTGAQPSSDPLSVVAPDGTYFVGTSPDGGIAFSRGGALVVTDGELRSTDGERPVLGRTFADRAAIGPLRVDPYDAALGRVSNARIEADGTFAYTRATVDPRTGERRTERVAVGRIALARFPAGTQPERIDPTHVRPPAGVSAQIGLPTDGRFAALVPRARDLGRVDLIAGIERMREAYDNLDAVRAAAHAHGSVDRTTMDLLK